MCLFSFSVINSQTDFENNKRIELQTAVSFCNNTFTYNDYYYGWSMGIEDVGFKWGARFNFQLRPFFKRSQIRESETIIRQYRERKYFVSIDIDKRLFNWEIGEIDGQLFLGTQIGFLLGDYKGTRNNAAKVFNTAPVFGFCLDFNDGLMIKLGAVYLKDNLLEVPDIKGVLNIIFILPENNNNNESEFDQQTDYY